MALARYCIERTIRLPALREVRTVSEIVTPGLRAACREAWGVPLADAYSSQEHGYLALQCREGGGLYHVQAERVLIEILDDGGRPCSPGQIGRVVVTDLHNFASPLIRYEIGDYAELGTSCPCGRGLPVLSRIIGRQRNMVTLPTGEKRWPLVGYLAAEPVRQYQVIQRRSGRLEVRLVPARPFTRAEEERVRALLVEKAFGYPFEIDFVYLEEIPRQPNGKFEEFMSELAH
jgi:phenylacetate-CoA ligase